MALYSICVPFWMIVNLVIVIHCVPAKKQLDYNQEDPFLYAQNMDTYYENNLLNLDNNKQSSLDDHSQCGTRVGRFETSRTSKIIGGRPVIYGAVPWQVQIQHFNFEQATFAHHCGGAVIGERLILSAAHCLQVGVILLTSITFTQWFFIGFQCEVSSSGHWGAQSDGAGSARAQLSSR